MLKIILLFFVCMYSIDFIPTLDRAILPAFIIDPCSFLSIYGGGVWGIFQGILLGCSLQIYVLCGLYVMISLCMFSYFHLVLSGAILPVAVDGSRSFFPVYGGWYSRNLLCITFIFVCFSVGFIWKNGSKVVSSLLVRAILLFVTNFSKKILLLKVCFRFYLMSLYLCLL